MTTPFPFFHSHRRFWNPVEGLYYQYYRPELIEALCDRCGDCVLFVTPKSKLKEVSPGVYSVQRGEVCGSIAGRGTCAKCGRIMHAILWPEAAYLQVRVPEGIVWAWNISYVPVLRARVEGDKVSLRQLVMKNWNLARFAARLPRFVGLKKNRTRILVGLERIARGERLLK